MSLHKRILLAIGLMFTFILAMFVITWYVSGLQATDGLVINLAGRQRMLTQKISKEYLLIISTKDEKRKGELKTLLNNSIEVFQKTHEALLNGGLAPLSLDPKGPTGEVPTSSGDTTVCLKKAGEMSKLYISYIRAKSESGEMRTLEEGKLEGSLLTALNSAVEAMQVQSESKVKIMLRSQGGCVIISLIALIILVQMVQKTLFQPLNRLLRYSSQVASGRLDVKPEGKYLHELFT